MVGIVPCLRRMLTETGGATQGSLLLLLLLLSLTSLWPTLFLIVAGNRTLDSTRIVSPRVKMYLSPFPLSV